MEFPVQKSFKERALNWTLKDEEAFFRITWEERTFKVEDIRRKVLPYDQKL